MRSKKNKSGTRESGIEADILSGYKPQHLTGKYHPVRDFVPLVF